MRRFITPAVLACLFVAAPSAQAQVEHHEVSKSKSSVESYWTAERMQAATPAEQQFQGGEAKAEAAPLPWTSAEVTTSYTQQPTSTHGKVFFTLGGSDYVCSGTAILSGNKSVVWTAGHCVNEGPGDFATNWEFVPAYKDGSAPLGVYVAEDLITSSAWANQGDFCMTSPRRSSARAAGRPSPTASAGAGSRSTRPARRPTSPTAIRRHRRSPASACGRCTSALQTSDNSASPPTLGIGCDMTGGSSGGGWIVGNNLVSENSYGYSNQPDVMFGPYLGSVAQSVYNAAAATE